MDHLTKSTHFIAFGLGQSMELLVEKYMQAAARLHGVLVSIVSDRDIPVPLLEESPGKFGDMFEV